MKLKEAPNSHECIMHSITLRADLEICHKKGREGVNNSAKGAVVGYSTKIAETVK